MSYSWLALFQGITGRGFYPTDAVWQFNLRENCWKCEIMMNQWKNKSYITYYPQFVVLISRHSGRQLKGSILAPEAAILVFYTASKHQTAFILLYSLKCLRFIDIDSVSSLFLSRSPVLVSVPDVCPPDWPTWVCGVRPPPGPGTSGSLRLRYIITTLTLVTHASWGGSEALWCWS